jgi:hypothetical protein
LLSVAPEWKSLFPEAGSGAMAGLNGDPSAPPLSRADLERAIGSAFQEAGVEFEKHFAVHPS